MKLKLRLEIWENSLVGQFLGAFPDELRGMVNFKTAISWSVGSSVSPCIGMSPKIIYLPGTARTSDNKIFSYLFETAEKAAEAKKEIISALREWEQSLHEDFEEEENVYVFEI
ncbi:MAG: hypothetical protein SWO11_22995 [Thermodesulfobacteriota bacterium]|nr:hypothetical protein [Thermodesulfobacteriota bacterium]